MIEEKENNEDGSLRDLDLFIQMLQTKKVFLFSIHFNMVVVVHKNLPWVVEEQSHPSVEAGQSHPLVVVGRNLPSVEAAHNLPSVVAVHSHPLVVVEEHNLPHVDNHDDGDEEGDKDCDANLLDPWT